MKSEMAILILKVLYKAGIRNLILKAINDPEEHWDDAVIEVLDLLMGLDQTKLCSKFKRRESHDKL